MPTDPLAIPARTGRMLGLSLGLPGGGTIVSSNAEIAELADSRVRFSAGLGDHTEVWLRTARTVTGEDTRTEGELTVVTGPAGATWSSSSYDPYPAHGQALR